MPADLPRCPRCRAYVDPEAVCGDCGRCYDCCTCLDEIEHRQALADINTQWRTAGRPTVALEDVERAARERGRR